MASDSSEQGATLHQFVVESADAGSRLDRWLSQRFPDLSRSLLKRYVQEERVRVQGSAAKPSTLLKEAWRVEIDLPPPPPPFPIAEDLPIDVIHEEASFLVINKSPDIVVHPSPGGAHAGGTLVNALLGFTENLSHEGGELRPGIVHRLDRETSGVMLIARDDAAHRHLSAQFKARTVKKEYLALCHGVCKKDYGEIDQPLGRSPRDRKKMIIRHDEEAKASHTAWRVERRFKSFTGFRCFPTTGRTHQIRVHLRSIDHPIICDAAYGREKKMTRAQIAGRKPLPDEQPALTRQALHATRIGFDHPVTGERVEFEAPLHDDMAALWQLGEEL